MTTTKEISEKIVPRDPRVEKLPMWAREHIALLRMRLGEARTDADSARTRGPEDTDTVAEPHAQSPIYLPRGARVVFRLTEGSYLTVHIMQDRIGSGAYLDVTASGQRFEAHRLYVSPQASNVVRVMTGDL